MPLRPDASQILPGPCGAERHEEAVGRIGSLIFPWDRSLLYLGGSFLASAAPARPEVIP
jgi:hypothetical protein